MNYLTFTLVPALIMARLLLLMDIRLVKVYMLTKNLRLVPENRFANSQHFSNYTQHFASRPVYPNNSLVCVCVRSKNKILIKIYFFPLLCKQHVETSSQAYSTELYPAYVKTTVFTLST